jgi:hypothetical protein
MNNSLDWKDLRPAVQLAIISQMSEHYSLTKIYDMLGLYAQELGDIRKLVAQHNYQSGMEDYLTYWMQQDQLRGILRTDHTSILRGAPEAYQEFQIRNYMRKIQAEIDESLLQANSAEVNLGRRFLAQQGIQQDMIGSWGCLRGRTYAVCSRDLQIQIPPQSVPVCGGLDSGYVSATISPKNCPMSQEAESGLVSNAHMDEQTRPHIELKRKSSSQDSRKLELEETPAPVQKQKAQQRKPTSPHSTSPCPADAASTTGSTGRSRRNLRRTSKYDEAIAELKLRGSGDERDSDYEMSDKDDQASAKPEPPMPSPRLRINFDNRIIGVPAPSQALMDKPDSGARLMQTSSTTLQIPQLVPASGRSTTPNRTKSPLPLPRVVIRPRKTLPKQANGIPHSSEDPMIKKFNQNLLGLHRDGNDFTKSLLKASERDAARATPWVSMQPKDFPEPGLPSTADHRRASGVTAPAFSPITERFSILPNREDQEKEAAVWSSPESVHAHSASLTNDETSVQSSLLATPNFTSTPMSEPQYLARNDRSIVTETGSPVPARAVPILDSTPSGGHSVTSIQQNVASSKDEQSEAVPSPATRQQQAAFVPNDIYRRLDPVTGNVIIDQPIQHNPTPAQPAKKPHSAPPSQTPRPLAALQQAGEEVKKAAADLKSVATELTKTTLPTIAANRPANNAEAAGSAPKKARSRTPKAANTIPSQEGTKEKRKYGKSEAQKLKEAARQEARERERRAREERLALKAREAEARRAERVVADAQAAK